MGNVSDSPLPSLPKWHTAFVRFDYKHVRGWNFQCEVQQVASACRSGLLGDGLGYEVGRGVFDIALSGRAPHKVPRSVFQLVNLREAILRQAVVLFDPKEVEKWDVKEQAWAIANAWQKALMTAGKDGETGIPGVVSISLHHPIVDLREMVPVTQGIIVDGKLVTEIDMDAHPANKK